MLSDQKKEHIEQQLEGDLPKGVRKQLNKKLTEHKYASKYPPFTPLSHQRYYINRMTEERTLLQVIQAANDSTIFLLDTESTLVYRKPNRPSLIQIQIISSDVLPLILIVEVNHLPPKKSNVFQLIQQLLRIVLDPNKTIYTWGMIEELDHFVRFGLFDTEQIQTSDNQNLQLIFKKYWQNHHKHERKKDCKCEECIGKKSNESWSLQDAVAYQLNEWLDKRYTCSSFNIGLDPRLNMFGSQQTQLQTTLSNYAANDCLSMEKLMISIQEDQPPEPTGQQAEEGENGSRIQDQSSFDSLEETMDILSIHPTSPLVNPDIQSTLDHEFKQHPYVYHEIEQEQRSERECHQQQLQHDSEKEAIDRHHEQEPRLEYQPEQEQGINHSNDKRQRSDRHFESKQELDHFPKRQRFETDPTQEKGQPIDYQQRKTCRSRYSNQQQHHTTPLTDIENKKRYRNRICTIKQRKRNYRYEIIRRGIDSRFSVTMVKKILRRYGIDYKAINISKSKFTRRTSLYIGIRHASKLHRYEVWTRRLFTTDAYNEFRAQNQL